MFYTFLEVDAVKQKVSQFCAPALAGVVKKKSIRAAVAEIKNCSYGGETMIELHLSCLNDTSIDAAKEMIGSITLPIPALHYNNTCEGSDAGYTEELRAERFLRATVEVTGVSPKMHPKSIISGVAIPIFLWERSLMGGRSNEKNKNRPDRHRSQSRRSKNACRAEIPRII